MKMYKLLAADFSRLWKNKIYLLCLIFLPLCCLFFSRATYYTALQKAGSDPLYVEDMLFNLLPLFDFVCVFVIVWFLGTEFDENTIRNKLIVGHTRTAVFLSEFVVCLTASLLLLALTLIVSGVCGIVFFKTFLCTSAALLYLLLCCVLLTAVLTAFAVGIGMNVHSKAASLAISLGLFFLLFFLASGCGNALAEPPTTYSDITVSVENGVQLGEEIDNPAYIEGYKRTLCELLYDALPTGQSFQLSSLELERTSRFAPFSLALLALFTAVGMPLFGRRDLR